jgi:uncharacterized protein YfeS
MGALVLGGCANPSADTTDSEDVEELPRAAPAFAAHFTDPVYNDEGDEFAPFGSDEGSDIVYESAERRDELGADATVADVIEENDFTDVVAELDTPEGPGIPKPGGQIDAATITVGAGFTLLRLAGHIDEAGRRQTVKALDILIHHYGSRPELLRERADLLSWTE